MRFFLRLGAPAAALALPAFSSPFLDAFGGLVIGWVVEGASFEDYRIACLPAIVAYYIRILQRCAGRPGARIDGNLAHAAQQRAQVSLC